MLYFQRTATGMCVATERDVAPTSLVELIAGVPTTVAVGNQM